MDNVTHLKIDPAERGDVLVLQIPGATITIAANVTDERGKVTTTVVVQSANDERGGDEHGNAWDIEAFKNIDHHDVRVVLAQRGPLMTNPEDYGQLVHDRLAELGLKGILDLGDGGTVRMGQVVVTHRDSDGRVMFLGGDRVLVGRPKIGTDSCRHYVYSPRVQRQVLVRDEHLHFEMRAPRWAYWINPAQDDRLTKGFVPSVVVEEVPGHWPLDGNGRPWVWGETLEQAQAVCAQENQRRHLGPEQVREITHSSMIASFTATTCAD